MYAVPPTESEYFPNLIYSSKHPQPPEPCDICTCDLIANTLPRVHGNPGNSENPNCRCDNDDVFHDDAVNNNNTHFHTVGAKINHRDRRLPSRPSRSDRPSVGSSIYGNTVPRSRRGTEPEYHSLRFSYPTLEFGGRARRESHNDENGAEESNNQDSIPRQTVEYGQYIRSDTSDVSESVRYFILEQNEEEES